MDYLPKSKKHVSNKVILRKPGRKRSRNEIHIMSMATSLVMGRKTKSRRVRRLPRVEFVLKGTTFTHARIDENSMINILPMRVLEELDCGYLKNGRVLVQLADRSLKRSRGFLKDVTITFRGAPLALDFVSFDIPHSGDLSHSPVILGKPFLAAAKATIDCETGSINFSEMGSDLISRSLEDTSQLEELITTLEVSHLEDFAASEVDLVCPPQPLTDAREVIRENATTATPEAMINGNKNKKKSKLNKMIKEFWDQESFESTESEPDSEEEIQGIMSTAELNDLLGNYKSLDHYWDIHDSSSDDDSDHDVHLLHSLPPHVRKKSKL